ncbi:protein of unknown function [Citrobacter amalonaticus]|uniref:Uncharacterized protein n=1 Tax=Citrobacter amalonaticus TaxID=35703 RepID=A0AAX2BDA8_CITAM|nr:protein of unknown function [Citrobacter amalonaticus]SAZ14642.1 protein of unknown function [Citrobacter amalonaticus]
MRYQNAEKLGRYVDEAFFLGGVEKTKVLKAFKPHIFFDDQDVHLIVAVYPINLRLHARATMQPKPYEQEADMQTTPIQLS